MTDATATPHSPEEPILEKVARMAGEPSLFPPEVLRLHREGRARRARKELLRAAKEERSSELASKQRAYAADLRLWQEPLDGAPTMYTLNGVGTRLYGMVDPAEDGTYIATLWITFVFVPIWPLAAYLVLPGQGSGWHFLSKTPLPPVAMGTRRGVGAVVAMLTLFAAYTLYFSATHAVVHAFNGFDRAVQVSVGETTQLVMPRQAAVFEDVPAAVTRFSAAWRPNEEPFESIDVDLADRARSTVVYNVAGRAVLQYDWIVYGDGPVPEGRLLEAGPVLFEERIDFPFSDPPDSMSVADGGSVERTLLYALDDGMSAETTASRLYEIGRREQAWAVAEAELTLHPENGVLAYFFAQTRYEDDRDAQLTLFRAYMERAPDAVELHRNYQELWPEGSEELRREYEALLEAAPTSAMHHYLVGRIADNGSAESAAHYNEALRLEPDYPPALRALGYDAVYVGDWSGALSYYARFAATGPEEMSEIADSRARVTVRAGRPWEDVDAVLQEALDVQPNDLSILRIRAHRLVQTGEGVTTVADALGSAIEARLPPLEASIQITNLLADLAITEGDLARARSELDGFADPSYVDPSVALRLALSEGATPADLERLESLPGWPFMFDPLQQLIVVGLVDDATRAELIERMDPSGRPIVELLESTDLRSPARLAELVAGLAPAMRMRVYYAAARALDGDALGARAREAYLREARGFALPGELPYER